VTDMNAAETLHILKKAVIARYTHEHDLPPPWKEAGHECEWCGSCMVILRNLERAAFAAAIEHDKRVQHPGIVVAGRLGRLSYIIPDRRTKSMCPVCAGRGHTLPSRDECTNCNGKGSIPYVPEKPNVTV